jgi:lysophospholipase L1-like esterase
MTTFNHGTITTGAAANAATFNTPLGELDAAIGNRAAIGIAGTPTISAALGAAALTTTAQTVLGAINEHDAEIGTVSTLSTTSKVLVGAINEIYTDVYTALDTDGTLKANAVDVAAVLASDVVETAKIKDANVTLAKLEAVTSGRIIVGSAANRPTAVAMSGDATIVASGAVTIAADAITAAKIANGALPSPNLVFDPHNRYFSPSSTVAQNGKVRWYNSTGTRVSDSSNPFGAAYTLRLSTTNTGGRKLWLSEMGVAIGDVLSFAIIAKVPTGRSVVAAIAWRNSNSVSLGTAVSTTVVGNAGTHVMTIDAQTVPATCVAVDLYISHISGTGDVDVYGWYCVRGSKIATQTTAYGSGDGQQAAAQLASVMLTGDTSFMTRVAYRDNLFRDPFSRQHPPTTRSQDGKDRWGATVANITYVPYDPDNPFKLPTLTWEPSSTAVTRRFYLDEMGVVVGDVISIGALVKFPATSTMAVAYAFRDAGGTSMGALAGTAAVGTAALQFLTNKNITVPAGSIYVDIYFSRSFGADPVDVYGFFANFGPDISEPASKLLGYEQRFTAGGWALRRQVDPIEAGIGNLQTWHRAQAGLSKAEASRTAKIAVIGDSISMTPNRWLTAFQTRIAADQGGGLAGAGYISFHSVVYGNMAGWGKFTSVTPTGSWTERNINDSPAGVGIDGCDVQSGAAGDTFTIVGTFDTATIHYLKQSGGGTFKYSIDGGSNWSANIDTSNATDLFAAEVVTGATNALLIYANGADVRLFGVELLDTSVTNGTIVHKCAYTGASLEEFVTASTTQSWQDSLTQLAPDLVIVWLGANNGSTNDATNKASMATILDNIAAALTVDVLLISPYEHETAHTYEFASTADRYRELVKEKTVALVDIRQVINYRSTDPQDFFEDATHINGYGGAVVASTVYKALKW